jgi:hypothetical protein
MHRINVRTVQTTRVQQEDSVENGRGKLEEQTEHSKTVTKTTAKILKVLEATIVFFERFHPEKSE